MTGPRRALVAAALVAAVASPLGSAQAQQPTKCDFHSNGSSSAETVNGMDLLIGGGGIRVVCPSRNMTLVADSGRKTGDQRVDLYGHVHYLEPQKVDLQSDFLTYIEPDERVITTGHVIAKLPTGSTITGPEITYLRVKPGRAFEEVIAPRNPVAVVISKGDSAKPTTVNAQQLYMRGDSLLYASRSVVISRVDMIARADSAFVDGRGGHETAHLMFNPSIEGLTGKKFKLLGNVIDLYSTNRKLDRVVARGSGHATSQDLEILADTIDLHISKDELEHAIAWSKPGLATAKSPGQTTTADSIDVVMPGGKVRVVYAVRRAFAEADADSSHYHTTEKDWLRGDLVTAWFDTTATKDTSSTPPLQRILATHRTDSARAYYHLTASDTACHQPAISYVRGHEIQLDFENKKISMLTVNDSVYGLYLEPCKDTTTAATSKSTRPGQRRTPASAKPPVKPPTTTAPKKPPTLNELLRSEEGRT